MRLQTLKKLKAEIEGLKKAKAEALAEAVKARKERAAARATQMPEYREQPQQQQAQEPTEPKPSDYQDYDAYIDAKINHEISKAKSRWEVEQEAKSKQAETQRRETQFQERVAKGFESHEDFDVVFDATLPITPMVKEILVDSPIPADVLYHLAHNRMEAVKISQMTPYAAAREIAAIESRLQAGGNGNTISPPPAQGKKQISKAPPPIKPIAGGPTAEKPLDKMSTSELEQYFRKKGLPVF